MGSKGSAPMPPKDAIDALFTFPQGLNPDLRRRFRRDALSGYSVLPASDPDAAELKKKRAASESGAAGGLSVKESRAVACTLFNAVGDALGAPLEFSPVRYGSKELKNMGDRGVWQRPGYNRFQLKPGQWTDDASMGLCIADSFLTNGGALVPRDLRMRFLNWWQFGYNNAFGFDAERTYSRASVGLGGNIGASLREFEVRGTEFTTAGNRRTSGNGSLMRNGPVPTRHWADPSAAMLAAYQQSKTTHQGDEAAEACRLLSLLCCRAIASDGKPDAKALLDWVSSSDSTFKSPLYSITCLSQSRAEQRHQENQGLDLAERNWNWKSKDFRYAPERSRRQPGYIGSYAMDNISMTLHCVYHTKSAAEAMLYCANMRGDSDSVCAVVGQLSGAIYGLGSVPKAWIDAVERWDGGGGIALRAYKLFKMGQKDADEQTAKRSREIEAEVVARGAVGPAGGAAASAADAKASGGSDRGGGNGGANKSGNDGKTNGSNPTDDAWGAGSGYAPAKHDCKHAASNITPKTKAEAKALIANLRCAKNGCDAKPKDLWICASCHEVLCGRYASGHMKQHTADSSHCIAMCFGDLSFWCYKCDSYLHHKTIRPVFDFYDAMHNAKFGESVPGGFGA